MSEASRRFISSADRTDKSGPDYFTYYSRLTKELLSQDEDSLPFAPKNGNSSGEVTDEDNIQHSSNGSFLSTRVGAGLSDQRKEILNTLLRQSVADLSPEVDLMFDSVVRMCQLQSRLRNKNLVPEHPGVLLDNAGHAHNKKLKMSSAPSSTGNSGSSREKHCSSCNSKNAPNWITDPEGKFLCNACEIGGVDGTESHFGSIACDEKGNEEGENDMRFLLENDGLFVEETVKKYSDELLAKLGHMEQQLEELLDTVVSSCRPMSISEKQQLQSRIGKLAPKNFERIAAIVQRNKPDQKLDSDEIVVNLLQEDDVTVQRLFYYVEAVEKARKRLL